MPGRIAAMSLAATRPQPLLKETGARIARRRPLPAQRDAASRVDSRRLRPASSTSSTRSCRTSSDVQSSLTASGVYGWTIRRSRIVIAISEHARATLIERYDLAPERVRAIPLAVDHAAFRPSDTVSQGSYLLYPARPWRHKNHARLFEAFARIRARPAGPAPRPHRRRRLRRAAAGRRGARARLAGRARPPVPGRRRARFPLALRRLRHAGPRGDGVRLSGRVLERDVAAGGRRRRCAPLRSARRRRRSPPRSRTCSPTREPWVARGLERAQAFTWDACARAHDEVYRELCSG